MSTKPNARRTAFALCCLSLFAALCAPEAAARQDDEVGGNTRVAGVTVEKAEESKSSVYGKAVFEDSGRPVRRARVMLLPFNTNEGVGERSALTDAVGEFRLTKVPPGRYYVAVDMKGVLSPASFLDLEQINKTRAPDMTQVGKNFDSIEVDGKSDKELTVRARRGGAIGGKVTYPDGDPAVNTAVHLLRVKDGRPVPFLNGIGPAALFGLRTDDRGVYRVAGLPPGEYIVGVAEAVAHSEDEGVNQHGYGGEYGSLGSPFGITFHPSARQAASATPVSLDAGEERDGVDIQIAEREERTIAGVVRGRRDKAPVQGASVTLTAREQGPTIISFVYGQGGAQNVTTDEAGRWLFKELPDGVYVLSVQPRMHFSQEEYEEGLDGEGEEEAEVEQPQSRAAKPKPKRLAPKEQEVRVSGGDVSDLVIELGEGARVSGTVVLEGQAASENDYLNVYAAQVVGGEERHAGMADMVVGGKFTIDGVPPGKLLLRFNQYGPNAKKRYIKSVTWRGKDIMREPPDLTEGAEFDDVRIVIAADMATLAVRAVTAKGKSPARDVEVALVPADPSDWQRSDAQATCVTGADGLCTLTTAPGEYLVITFNDGGGVHGQLTPAEIKERAPTATRLKLQSGETKPFEVVTQ